MARNIYSIIKIEKRQTKRGIYASAFGTMVHGAFYINLASVMIHGLIFLAGCLSIIM